MAPALQNACMPPAAAGHAGVEVDTSHRKAAL
jgi:hypothetical protein